VDECELFAVKAWCRTAQWVHLNVLSQECILKENNVPISKRCTQPLFYALEIFLKKMGVNKKGVHQQRYFHNK
jgi:hypothetical protein